MYRILAINPGSTSTKIAVFEDEKQVFDKTLRHKTEEIEKYATIADQFEFRKEIILGAIQEAGIDIASLQAVVGRGGLLRPIESGVYEVNSKMKEDLRDPNCRQHASNLGALIADSIASTIPGAKAYIADPVVVDEMDEVARITGLAEVKRESIFHALNQKAIARVYAKKAGKKYEEMNLIVAHLGGGISVGAHRKGRVVDVNNALYGDGPFSPERAGAIPTAGMLDLCYSGKFSLAEAKQQLCGKGGLVSLMGYNDAYQLEKDAKAGEPKAVLIREAMFYNVAKQIGAMGATLEGKVDAILVTGGVAYDPDVKPYMEAHVGFIAPVVMFPGEDEMAALSLNALMALQGEVTPKEY